MAYDLESLLSPLLTAVLLTFVSNRTLFDGTAFGFLASAALVLSVTLPQSPPAEERGFWDRTTRGMRIYLATPRLRGLLALNLAIAAGGAMVIVNTVVFVKVRLGLSSSDVATALAFYGGGAMVAAFCLTRLLDRVSDRSVMLTGSALLILGCAAGPLVSNFPALLALWLVLGFGYSMAQTPGGRLIRRSADAEDRPAVFAAQFALSHACWLISYPLAGWMGTKIGLDQAFLTMAAIGTVGILSALLFWREP